MKEKGSEVLSKESMKIKRFATRISASDLTVSCSVIIRIPEVRIGQSVLSRVLSFD